MNLVNLEEAGRRLGISRYRVADFCLLLNIQTVKVEGKRPSHLIREEDLGKIERELDAVKGENIIKIQRRKK